MTLSLPQTVLRVTVPNSCGVWYSSVFKHPDYANCTDVSLDLSQVAEFDLEELEVLAHLVRHLRRAGKQLQLADVPRPILSRLAGLGLAEALGLHPTSLP